MQCNDMDECTDTVNPCSEKAKCKNSFGSYTCTCEEGFTGNGKICTDVDECNEGKCSANTTCLNTEGSYTCSCKPGFISDRTDCYDRNECEEKSHNCSSNAVCTNTVGSYDCSCKEHYR